MIIVADKRNTHKTTKAIELAFATNSLLIVANRDLVSFTERHSIEMKCPVHVVSAESFLKNSNIGRYQGENIRTVVVDDLDRILRDLFGVEVLMATTNGMVANMESDNEESWQKSALNKINKDCPSTIEMKSEPSKEWKDGMLNAFTKTEKI